VGQFEFDPLPNVYGYVAGNPTSRIDSDGHFALTLLGGISGGLLGGLYELGSQLAFPTGPNGGINVDAIKQAAIGGAVTGLITGGIADIFTGDVFGPVEAGEAVAALGLAAPLSLEAGVVVGDLSHPKPASCSKKP
jgi:hypothetical protein